MNDLEKVIDKIQFWSLLILANIQFLPGGSPVLGIVFTLGAFLTMYYSYRKKDD